MIISRTPFRVSLFGGGTDYPQFYEANGGATLSATIDQYCYISVHKLSAFFKYRFRASYAKTELVQQPEEFHHPLIRECLLFLGVETGLEISHTADLPGETGLGSSSSFTVGLLHALHTYRGEATTPEQLAREAITVERERVGDAGGHQDQYAAAYGGFNRIDYRGSQHITVRRLALPESRLKDLQRHLMMFYAGTGRPAQVILEQQTRQIQHKTGVLQEMHRMVDEAERILAGNQELTMLGSLLHEAWERKKGLAPGISTPVVDEAYDAAREAGALGGKLLGAGGRGFLLVLARPEAQESIRQSLVSLREVPLAFSQDGSHIIFHSAE